MAKRPTITDITSGHGTTTVINDNFNNVQTAFDNTLSRDGSTPNAMGADLDMDSNKILNLPAATTGAEPVTYSQFLSEALGAVVSDGVFVNSIAALKALDTAETTHAVVTGYYTKGDGGGGVYFYDSSDTSSSDNGGTVIVADDGTSRWKLQYVDTVSVKQFGAKGDWNGTSGTDDTTAIQACFNAIPNVVIPAGGYRVTSTLNLPNRVNVRGSGDLWSAGNYTDNTEIVWDGATSTTTPVIKAATADFGTEPTSTVSNVKLSNILINGKGKAGIGLYCGYVLDESVFEQITVRETTNHGFFIIKTYYCKFRDLTARNNENNGITISSQEDEFTGAAGGSWAFADVNGVVFENLRAAQNGTAGNYDEATDQKNGVGIYYHPWSGGRLQGGYSESNNGPGLVYVASGRSSSKVSDFYLEANCVAARDDSPSRSTRSYGLVVLCNANARANEIENLYLHGETGNANAQGIRIDGSNPTGTLTFKNIAYGRYFDVDAAITNYSLREYIYFGLTGANRTGPAPLPFGSTTGKVLNSFLEGSVSVTGKRYEQGSSNSGGRYNAVKTGLHFQELGNGDTADLITLTKSAGTTNLNMAVYSGTLKVVGSFRRDSGAAWTDYKEIPFHISCIGTANFTITAASPTVDLEAEKDGTSAVSYALSLVSASNTTATLRVTITATTTVTNSDITFMIDGNAMGDTTNIIPVIADA